MKNLKKIGIFLKKESSLGEEGKCL